MLPCTYLDILKFIFLNIYLSFYHLSIYRSIDRSIYLGVYLSIYLGNGVTPRCPLPPYRLRRSLPSRDMRAVPGHEQVEVDSIDKLTDSEIDR